MQRIGDNHIGLKVDINPEAIKLVEYVFANFYILCRGSDKLFEDANRTAVEKRKWQQAFTRNRYKTPEDIKKAIFKLENHKHPNPPQLGEFLAWNKSTPEDLGLLSKELAYTRMSEFIREGSLWDLSNEQNMLLELAIHYSDSYFLRNNPEAKVRPVFERNYEIAVRDFMAGKLKPIAKALENKSDETMELQKQNDLKKDFDNLKGHSENMARIKQLLGMR